jgi:hypothetical protein
VALDSPRSATPSFTAGSSSEVYLFSLTVRDGSGTVSTDMAVVSTRRLAAAPDASDSSEAAGPLAATRPVQQAPTIAQRVLGPINLSLFILAALLVLLAAFDRLYHLGSRWRIPILASVREGKRTRQHVRVVHYQTNESIVGARAVITTLSGVVVTRRRTNLYGSFGVALEPGSYLIKLDVKGFTLSPGANSLSVKDTDVVYAGGELVVKAGELLSVVVPMKPTGETVTSMAAQALEVWQVVQRQAHRWSWPALVVGAALNTVLMLWLVAGSYLFFELGYVGLVLIKILLGVRLKASYGVVRDAITRIPLDLAVVRLYEHGTNRLVLTRVTDDQGRFFALPPPGTYNIVVAKPGYATFSKDEITVSDKHDTTLSIKANLMPIVPQGGFTPVMKPV